MPEKRYVTHYKNHQMVYKPSYLQVVNGIPVTVEGEVIQFENGVYKTDDPEKQAFIEKNPDFGINIFDANAKEKEEEQAKPKALEEMTKAELIAFAKDNFGLELDEKLKKETLIEAIQEEQAARDNQ
jgi:hypothetical protein